MIIGITSLQVYYLANHSIAHWIHSDKPLGSDCAVVILFLGQRQRFNIRRQLDTEVSREANEHRPLHVCLKWAASAAVVTSFFYIVNKNLFCSRYKKQQRWNQNQANIFKQQFSSIWQLSITFVRVSSWRISWCCARNTVGFTSM